MSIEICDETSLVIARKLKEELGLRPWNDIKECDPKRTEMWLVVDEGGYLKADARPETLRKYKILLEELDRPFLGICLGMKILGFCYGARIGRVPAVIGDRRVFLRGYPLCPGLSDFVVHQNHRYELIRPLPAPLEDFTAGSGPVQAVKG